MRSRLEVKRRLVIGALAVVTMWPLAHRALVAWFALNPWKFYGWAMFCIPNPRTFAALYEFDGDRPIPLRPGRLRAEDERAVREYAAQWQMLGRLTPRSSIAAIAHRLLDEDPHLQRVGVIVTQLTLDATTARIAPRQEAHVYER